MAMMRYGSANVVESNVSPDTWTKAQCCGHKSGHKCGENQCRVKVAKTVVAKYDPKKYLLSHCTIVAAVETELADPKDPKSNYLIHPVTANLVNNNGDAWEKDLLKKTYRTFIGCNNFSEHVQILELSKGKVVDAVLREIPLGKDKDGKEHTTYYVDILVATDRKHKDLVAGIESGQIDKMSMGCKISFSRCTKCGKKAKDETEACDHVKYEKNNMFYDNNGIQRKIAELCGDAGDPESVVFVDASWVRHPAFTGAVKRNVIQIPGDMLSKIQAANAVASYEYKEGDFLKAAKIAADPPVEEIPGPDAPAADTPPDMGAADTPPDAGAPPDMGATDAPPDAGAPPPDAGAPPPGMPPQSPIKTWKTDIKKKLLDELSSEILKEFSGEEDSGRPKELETLDENFIQPTAALKQMWKVKKSWDNYLKRSAGDLNKDLYEKLKFGTLMLLNSNDMTVLAKYGYSRRDFLAVMSFLDSSLKNPLNISIKKAIASINGSQNKTAGELLTRLKKAVNRDMTKDEVRKSFVWLRLMDFYKN